MNTKISKIFEERIRSLISSKPNYNAMYPEEIVLKAEFACTKDPVPWKDRLKLKYKQVTEGTVWGEAWNSAWFHVTGTVPKSFAGKELCLHLCTESEILLFDEKGVPLYGLTDSSIFDTYFCKERFFLKPKKAGEKIDFWFEAAANALFGVNLPAADEIEPPHPHGDYTPVVKTLRLSVFDREVWMFLLEMETLANMLDAHDRNDYRDKQLLHALTKAMDVYNYNPAKASAAREVLKKTVFTWKAEDGALIANTIGHAHIDVGWLWPVRESTRKAARTYSSQIELMNLYPDFKFGASQAYLYKQVKENYPGLYAKVKKRIREGRWEVQGGMFIEADCNLISGESMVRQFLHGKNFFRDEFGVDVRNLWLPDVFGYSAAMPQILRKAGCDYFLTQKISWSQFNTFPHHTFRWIGVDGTDVLTHFLPENDYNAAPAAQNRIKAANRYNEAGILPGFMSLVGIGDGGGGPSENYIERNRIIGNLRGCPRSQWRFASDFFEEMRQYESELPVWQGELYLELHRGTLTTQAHTKRNNRKCEQALTALEILTSCLPAKDWPRKKLDDAWKTLLLNQFHDIIPGSSIRLVYERTEREHAEILAMAAEEMHKACAKLFRKNDKSAVLVNTLSVPWTGLAELPGSWNDVQVLDEAGKVLPSQKQNGKTFVLVSVPGNSFLTLRKGKAAKNAIKKTKSLVLENELIRYEFNKQGRLIHAFDKELQKEFLSGEGNALTLYHDRPLNYEAWDVDLYYRHDAKGTPDCTSAQCFTGKAGASLELVFQTEKSEIRQKIVLASGSKRLDFITNVDWHESRTLLRTSFPVSIVSDKAAFDIQYAHIERPTHNNTTWDIAKFETCGQRYADLSDRSCGAALLNDCKYGYYVKGNMLDLALLRSPKYPDRDADQGEHTFTYSFLPHAGSLIESNVMQNAAALNRNLIVADGFEEKKAVMPFHLDSDGISLEVVKRAEKDDSLILRLVETKGKYSKGTLHFRTSPSSVTETDLMEWNDTKKVTVTKNTLVLSMKPFEIRTYRVR